jgi:hypothetical protein
MPGHVLVFVVRTFRCAGLAGLKTRTTFWFPLIPRRRGTQIEKILTFIGSGNITFLIFEERKQKVHERTVFNDW